MPNLFSPIGLIRKLGFLCSALTVLAVALGHGVGDPTRDRLLTPPRYHASNGYLFNAGDPIPRRLDTETGALTPLRIDSSARLEYVAFSPWKDGMGQSRLLGLWEDSQGRVTGSMSRSLGLAWYTYPEGRVLDRVPLEVIPTSVPCWYPGMSSRVLFAAADGNLYRCSFDDVARRSQSVDDYRRPRLLEWEAAPIGAGGMQIGDTIWPAERGFGKTLIASLSFLEAGRAVPTMSPAQLWWLRLNTDGTAIEAAGRLTPGGSGEEERWPALISTHADDLALAYLFRPSVENRWELRVARVTLDPKEGTPRARIVREGLSGLNCLTTSPAFSPDGRWLNVLVREEKNLVRVERIGTDTLFDGHAPALVE